MLGSVFLTTMEIDLNKIGNDFLNMMGFSGGALVKKPLANAEDTRSKSLISGSGRSSGEGNSNPLQYFCLENSMNRGAEPGRLQSMGSQRVGHDQVANVHFDQILFNIFF